MIYITNNDKDLIFCESVTKSMAVQNINTNYVMGRRTAVTYTGGTRVCKLTIYSPEVSSLTTDFSNMFVFSKYEDNIYLELNYIKNLAIPICTVPFVSTHFIVYTKNYDLHF